MDNSGCSKTVRSLDEMIWLVVANIPKGRVTTYGQIAKQCGYAGHARYVGSVLKKLPIDTTLPWHRVITAKGKIAFANGSDAYLKQKYLLESEGIIFQDNHISLPNYGWGESD